MRVAQTIYCILFLMLVACSNPSPKENQVKKENDLSEIPKKQEKESAEQKKGVSEGSKEPNNYYESLLVPKTEQFAGYRFEFGYTKYNEEKYGFQNPGYLRIFHDGIVIFKDQFEGEGEVDLKSLGRHDLGGKKLVFTLNYGTPACDYTQVSRYYVVSPDHKARFIEEKHSSCGGDGYACHIFNHIFPEDSLGKPNTILFAEGIVYNEHDQEDQMDTVRISFSKNSFKVIKTTKK